MAPRFEIHLENFHHALHICDGGYRTPVKPLVDLLNKYEIRPVVYAMKDPTYDYGMEEIHELKFIDSIQSHGVHHYYDEKADRSPYFNQEGIPFPPAGGFFFRVLPTWLLRWAINRTGVFWIHPHDLDAMHPKLKNPLMNWKRHVGLKGALKKLERLIESGIFGD